MQNQHTTSRNSNFLARAIIIALAVIILAQGLDLPARHVLDFLTAVLEHTLVLLPSLTLSAWQNLHPAAFEQPHIPLCILGQILVTSLVSIT